MSPTSYQTAPSRDYIRFWLFKHDLNDGLLTRLGYCLSEVAHITELGRTCQTLLSKNPNKFNYKALHGGLLNAFNLAIERAEEALM
jgi:hypothetical protein